MLKSEEISIDARHLGKRYGSHTALADLSFKVKRGEIVGFLGPNGAGKSTTLRILTGALPATSGSLTVCGIAVAHDSGQLRRKIGYMPENNPLPDELQVIEYLRFRSRIKGIPKRHQRAYIEYAMEVCELSRKARRKLIGTLSKGFRQRVGIADAILARPEITILDEPTIGLDPHQVIGIRKLLDQLRGDTTVIFSSHILAEVEISCDRVLILNQGRLVASGTADELRREFLPGAHFRLEARGNLPAVSQFLSQIHPDATVSPPVQLGDEFHRIDIHFPTNGVEGESLLRQFNNLPDFSLRSFHRQSPSLEQIFLTATRRSWEQSDEVTDQRQNHVESPNPPPTPSAEV